MIGLTQKLKYVKDALNAIDVDVFHYYAHYSAKNYIVWAETGEAGSISGDDYKLEQTISGTIDYFTFTEYDPVVDEIQNALNKNKISFVLNSVQYEEETGLIHYEWEFEV